MAPDRPLLIVDDVFPHPASAFRYHEILGYLRHFPGCRVATSAAGFRTLGERRPPADLIADFDRRWPDLAGRVEPLTMHTRPDPSAVGYGMLVNNLYAYGGVFERHDVPFAFTLYPGGGFSLEDSAAVARLEHVVASRMFRHVVVTTRAARDLLRDRRLVPEQRVTYLYGGVVPPAETPRVPVHRYPLSKDVLDVGFVAPKHTPHGRDEGFDVFVQAAWLMCRAGLPVRFHVVGGFGPDDLEAGLLLGDQVTFHGRPGRELLADLYAGMDVVLSPGASGERASRGVPTRCSAEAALAGVALVCSDPTGQNDAFTDGHDIVLVPRDAVAAADAIAGLLRRPDDLARIARNGQATCERVFGLEAQLGPRLAVLESLLADGTPPASGPRG